MRILILGGTAFLSEATAQAALERGHQVSCLARGSTTQPPGGTTWIRADRDDGPAAYEAVRDQDWDAVIDVAMQPIHVRQALDALAGRTHHWTFVSTISVYADESEPEQDESAAVHAPLSAGRFTEMSDYGPAKVACENAVTEVIGERSHIVRAGLIGGPGDRSDRVGYWPARFARDVDDQVLAPDFSDPVQLIDVGDLAAWLVYGVERAVNGIFNATGDPVPFPVFLAASATVAGHRGRTIPVDPAFLVDHGVNYWAGQDSLPLWVPAEMTGFGSRSIAAATSAGMQLRPLEQTLTRALEYERTLGLDRRRRSGLSPATEERVLDAWQTERGADESHRGTP